MVDDATIRLFDLRKSNRAQKTFYGHTGWVKNVELIGNSCFLSASFDGTIRKWDLNQGTPPYFSHRPPDYPSTLFNPNCILNNGIIARMRVTYNHSKMIISLRSGHTILIHSLDVDHLKSDFEGINLDAVCTKLKRSVDYSTFF
jgi:WD40 repeat protein